MSDPKDVSVTFFGLAQQRERIGKRIDEAVLKVLDAGAYVFGPEMRVFEAQMAQFAGCSHVVSCANGTDAIALAMMAWDVKPGDAIFCPSFTFCATVEVVPWLGATPVFVDIDPLTNNMSAEHLEASIEMIKREGKLTPKVVIAVDLYGHPADYPAISAVARKHGLKLIADSAQGFGATINGKHPVHWADAATTSFFPAKPLGCYGDGGAILTDDAELVEVLESLRVHGKASKSDIIGKHYDYDPAKYVNIRIGMNSRLDTVQAAILIEKLAIFADELDARDRIAARYNELLRGAVESVPCLVSGGRSTWAFYTVEVNDRDELTRKLMDQNIPSSIIYPFPMHTQGPYKHYPVGPGGLPVSEAKAKLVLSLPMHPYLDERAQDRVVAVVTGQ